MCMTHLSWVASCLKTKRELLENSALLLRTVFSFKRVENLLWEQLVLLSFRSLCIINDMRTTHSL